MPPRPTSTGVLSWPAVEFTLTAPSLHPLRRLWTYGRPYRGRLAAAAATSVVNKVLDIAPPALIGAAVDIVVERNESWFGRMLDLDVRSQIVFLAGVTVAIWVLESITEYAHGRLWRGLAQTVQHDLRLDAYRHVQGLELAYFEDRSTGGLMTILGDDINQLERFLDTGANDLIQVAVTVVVIGSAFFVLAPEVAWMAVEEAKARQPIKSLRVLPSGVVLLFSLSANQPGRICLIDVE